MHIKFDIGSRFTLATRIALTSSVALAGLVSTSCGGDPEPKTADDVALHDDQGHQESGIQMSSEIGGLNQDQVDRTFEQAWSDLERCLGQGARRVEFLGGDVHFFLKVDQEGKLAHAHLEQSTLGDQGTEECMVDALKERTWPRPVGGRTGLARKSLSFEPSDDVRPPTVWSADDVQETLDELGGEISSCKNGSRGQFTVTMYVDTDGSVMSAGVAHAEDGGDETARCLLTALSGATYPSPGSWPAKVSLQF